MDISNLIKKGCKINDYGELDISFPYDKEKLGIKSWGYIDYIVRNKIYPVFRVTKNGKRISYAPIFPKEA